MAVLIYAYPMVPLRMVAQEQTPLSEAFRANRRCQGWPACEDNAIVEDAVAPGDKKDVEQVLREGSDALSGALAGIDEEAASLRPRPDSWSILDCVEHIALTEMGLLLKLRDAEPAERSHEDRFREARFQALALNRERRIEAPELVLPAQRFPTLAHAFQAFQAARQETLRWLGAFDGDLRSWLTIHPLITRPVNCYEMLLLIALHPKRHSQQIVEIREQLSPLRGQIH